MNGLTEMVCVSDLRGLERVVVGQGIAHADGGGK